MRNAVWILLAGTLALTFGVRSLFRAEDKAQASHEPTEYVARPSDPPPPALKLRPGFNTQLKAPGKAPGMVRSVSDPELLPLVLKDARTAIGYSRLRGLKTGVMANGSAVTHAGQTADAVRYSFVFASKGRFIERLQGGLNAIFGYDGKTTWALSWTRSSELESLNTGTSGQLAAWVRSGHWLASPSPFKLSLEQAESDATRVAIRMKGAGFQDALLYLDRQSSLPNLLLVNSNEGVERWRFDDYAVVEGVRVARRVDHDGSRSPSRLQMTELAIATRSAAELFEPLRFQAGRFKNLESTAPNAPS